MQILLSKAVDIFKIVEVIVARIPHRVDLYELATVKKKKTVTLLTIESLRSGTLECEYQ